MCVWMLVAEGQEQVIISLLRMTLPIEIEFTNI